MLPMNLAALAFNRPLDHGKLSSTTRPTSASSIPAMSPCFRPRLSVYRSPNPSRLRFSHQPGWQGDIREMAENAGGFRVPDLAL
jgi:hypothetical protein